MTKKIHCLCVTNKYLPESDYRINYPHYSKYVECEFALPSKPNTESGGNHFEISLHEGVQLSDIFQYFRLLLFINSKGKSYDFIHFYATIPILLGPFISTIARKPCLITLTGLGRIRNAAGNQNIMGLQPLFKVLLRNAIRLSCGVLFQTLNDLETVSNWFPGYNHKYFYVGSATKTPRVYHKDFNNKPLIVVLATRLIPEKGIDDFLRVAELLHNDDIEFRLIGPPAKNHSTLISKILNYHKEKKIKYLGELSPMQTLNNFSEAHIIFFPSTYGEGIPRVLLEAGYAQLCPIAYIAPFNNELISNTKGYLIEPHKIKEVIDVIKFLEKNRTVLRDAAISYQEKICEYYSIEKYSNRMDNILNKIGIIKAEN